MSLKPVIDTSLKLLYTEIQKFHLRPVKKLSVQFDPFHKNAKTVRDILFHISASRVRKTSQTCVLKSEIVCDRSEPIISIDLLNGMNVLFKCGNLTPVEIAREFNHIVEKYDVKEEKPVLKLKGALKEAKTKRR